MATRKTIQTYAVSLMFALAAFPPQAVRHGPIGRDRLPSGRELRALHAREDDCGLALLPHGGVAGILQREGELVRAERLLEEHQLGGVGGGGDGIRHGALEPSGLVGAALIVKELVDLSSGAGKGTGVWGPRG